MKKLVKGIALFIGLIFLNCIGCAIADFVRYIIGEKITALLGLIFCAIACIAFVFVTEDKEK